MPETPDLGRLRGLVRELRPAASECPFVVDAAAAKHVALAHYSGGRDAAYVMVSRKLDGQRRLDDFAVRIGYRPFVEGTTIIYDATSESMQGKARPFVCTFDPTQRVRVYAVMPFQIEQISLRTHGQRLSVGFLDARGEPLEAALPFELRLVDAGGNVLTAEHHSTDRGGRFSCDVAQASMAVVRSLLTGNESLLRLEPRSALRD